MSLNLSRLKARVAFKASCSYLAVPRLGTVAVAQTESSMCGGGFASYDVTHERNIALNTNNGLHRSGGGSPLCEFHRCLVTLTSIGT